MSSRTLSALIITAALTVTGIAPAIAGATVTHPGRAHVAVKSTYVYKRAGVGFSGTMFRGQTFNVERVSPSGKNAYGMAYGHINRHVWIKASALGK